MKKYFPLLYSEKIKRPDKNFFLTTVIGEDFIIILLAFYHFSYHPLSNTLGLFLLQISFWCIYELGYIENDLIGEQYEENAILSSNYQIYKKNSFPMWQPWLWAVALSLLGLLILSKNLTTGNNQINLNIFEGSSEQLSWLSYELICWLGFLVLSRYLFHIYNYLNKQSRIWFYTILQTCRYCGYLIIIPTNTIGLILLVSKVLTRSIQYILYRYLGGKNSSWPWDFPRYFYCLLIYLLLLGVLAINERDFYLIANLQVLSIVAFCLARGSKHFLRVFTQFTSVQEDGSNKVT
ncbi:hypothetical protein NIES4102_36460 [Chondrocystis sp. NIES-4102]|nr:hypothetical protein NIES4102_36460 [Chondrocystis sp. NIES-4102]